MQRRLALHRQVEVEAGVGVAEAAGVGARRAALLAAVSLSGFIGW